MRFQHWLTRVVRFCRTSILLSLFAAAANAHTYTVGPGSGTDFPDIPTAIAAAQPGDVLLVEGASYAGGFTLDKGLTILGYGGVELAGLATVTTIPADQRAVIVNISVAGVDVERSAGLVVLQHVSSSDSILVTRCVDVRCLSVTSTGSNVATNPGITVSNSRVEIVDSSLEGSSPFAPCCTVYDGGTGVVCGTGGRIHLADTDVRSGDGENIFVQNVTAGNGGAGILTSDTAQVIAMGTGTTSVTSGAGGLNWSYQDCCFDGQGLAAAQLNGGTLWYGDIVWNPGWDHGFDTHGCCDENGQTSVFSGPGAHVDLTPPDPTLLTMQGVPSSGATIVFVVRGPVGARAHLAFGRRTTIVPGAPSEVEKLVATSGSIDLGMIPATGEIDYTVSIPDFLVANGNLVGWGPGTFFVAQAETVASGSVETQRSNSVPVVVR